MKRRDRKLELFLLVLLVLRFSVFLPHVFWIYIISTGITTYFAIKLVWPERIAFHLQIPSRSQLWIWGGALGVAAAGANIWIRWEFNGVAPVLDQGWYLQIIFLPIIQFFVAATAEEPLFRGLLWGYLKRLGRSDWVILVVQALLFFVCHAYYARPGLYANWGSTLFMGFVFGIAAWKTRSILPSMIAHALVNGLTQAFTSSLK